MPENLLDPPDHPQALLLALLYLFFLRVLRAVWAEVKSARSAKAPDPSPVGASRAGAARRRPSRRRPPSRSQAQPAKGGRALPPPAWSCSSPPSGAAQRTTSATSSPSAGPPAARSSLPDDTYVSQLHARVFQADGPLFVEDLGSTNGTFLNGERISAPTALQGGDRLQVGATVLELE